MKKIFLLTLVFSFMGILAQASFADGYDFEPINPNGYTYVQPQQNTTHAVNVTQLKSLQPASEVYAKENTNYQNAILQLDNAQAEVRGRLLDLNTKYTEIDAKYNIYKEQRKTTKKLLKQAEKKIKSIEQSKERIKKEMI